MTVITEPHADHESFPFDRMNRSRQRAKSSGTVTLKLRADPSHNFHGNSQPFGGLNVVGERVRKRGAIRWATSPRNPWGVWANQRPERGRVCFNIKRSPFGTARLIVSATGRAANAAPLRRAATMPRARRCPGHQRPRRVMNQHHPPFGRHRGQPPAHRVGPFAAPRDNGGHFFKTRSRSRNGAPTPPGLSEPPGPPRSPKAGGETCSEANESSGRPFQT
jgi:hypothetical protein